MKIGLIDVDGHNYINLPLAKLSAWHKSQGDTVEWYEPFKAVTEGIYDKVYCSKVFSFTQDYQFPIYAKEIVKGGSGYCITMQNGREVFDKSKDSPLPPPIEHIYPDYSIYGITDTAYGFMSRGCPRGCSFCHVAAKEGQRSHKVADLSEFWQGQPNIELLDPNTLACKDWKDILMQLIESKAKVNFNQGVDIRLMTEEKAEYIEQVKTSMIHFAWDRYEDKDVILPKLKMFREISTKNFRNLTVYCLCNFGSTIEQDFERVYTLRELGFAPYVMLYDKAHLPKGHILLKLQRWVNNRYLFWATERFEDVYPKSRGTYIETRKTSQQLKQADKAEQLRIK